MSHAEPGPHDDLDALLLALQRAVITHPVAAQALFQALMAEGRRYARTPEGAAWARRLERSELVERTRIVWDVITLRVLEDDPDVVLPSALLDVLVQVAGRNDLEPFLSRLFERHVFAEEGSRP